MSRPSRPDMLYIARLFYEKSTKGWWVRIAQEYDWGVSKVFADNKYGGKRKALLAAKQWRNKQTKILKPIMDKVYPTDQHGTRYWGKGWSESWKHYPNGTSYMQIVAKYYDKKKSKQIAKSFSVNKYGYQKAVELAEQWRRLKLFGKL